MFGKPVGLERVEEYVSHLHGHLHAYKPIDQLIEEAWIAHRSRRFLLMYLLRDKETFYYYYHRKHSLGIAVIFDQLIESLFHKGPQERLKKEIIKKYEIDRRMAGKKVSRHLIKEADKDIASYAWYVNRRKLRKMHKSS